MRLPRFLRDPYEKKLGNPEDFTRHFDFDTVRAQIRAEVGGLGDQRLALQELDALQREGRALTIQNMSKRITAQRAELACLDLPLSAAGAAKLGADLVISRLIAQANGS